MVHQYPLQGTAKNIPSDRKDIEIKINPDSANLLNPTIVQNKMYVDNPEPATIVQTQVTTTHMTNPAHRIVDYTQSPRHVNTDVSVAYLSSPSSRRVRVSETGNIGTTPGISRSPKRVIATEEIDSQARGYYPSLDKPVTEKVTVYEGEPVVVGRVPAEYNIAHHTTVINPVVEQREVVQVAEPRHYLSPRVVTH